MTYNILTKTAPKMPRLTAGTECINLLLKNVSKDMREPITPMLLYSALISAMPRSTTRTTQARKCAA